MHTRIQHLAIHDRPREKLQNKGVQALSDFELLQVMIGSGTKTADVGTIALSLQRLIRKRGLDAIQADHLRCVPGMSTGKTSLLLAAIEFMKRQRVHDGTTITCPEDILPLVQHLRKKKQEHLVAITLDGANTIINLRTITIGTLTASLIHPREVFAHAISERAASMILVHNHPSGVLEPSAEDRKVTSILSEVGTLLGIPLLDHLIVSKQGWISLGKKGLLQGQSAPFALQSPTQFYWFFRTNEDCLEYLFELGYGQQACPACGQQGTYEKHKTHPRYHCSCGQSEIFPCKGTMFEQSTLPLTTWFQGIYLLCKNSTISTKAFTEQLDISSAQASKMLRQIRNIIDTLEKGDLSPEATFLRCLEESIKNASHGDHNGGS